MAKWLGKKRKNNNSRLKHVFSTSKYNKTRPREAMMDDNSVPSLFVDTPMTVGYNIYNTVRCVHVLRAFSSFRFLSII